MHRRRQIMAAASIVTILIIAALFMTRSINDGSSNQCLNNTDYQDLTRHNMPATVSPKTNFYSYVLEYSANDIVSDNEQGIAATIANFYKTHPDKSIHITLSGINQDPTTSVVASKRLSSFADKLKQGGIKPSVITSQDPQFYELDSDSAGVLTITITTGQECTS